MSDDNPRVRAAVEAAWKVLNANGVEANHPTAYDVQQALTAAFHAYDAASAVKGYDECTRCECDRCRVERIR